MKRNIFKLPYLLIAATILLFASLYFQSSTLRTSATQTEVNLGLSSDYTIPADSLISQVATASQSLAFDSSQKIPPRFHFFFQCQQDCGRFWISYRVGEQPEKIFIVTHPFFKNNPLHHLEKGQLRLYQQQPQYRSIDEFVQNPPKQQILTDSFTKNNILSPFAKTLDLNSSSTASAQYLLTNYKNPRQFQNNWYEVSRFLLDVSTPNSTISATLHHPDWQSNPMLITKPELE